MNGFELNKIAAAVLVAGIVTLGTGIFTKKLFHGAHGEEHSSAERAYKVMEGAPAAVADAAPAKPVIEPVSPLLANANVQKGQDLTKKCAACHSFDKGGPNKVGPNLWNIVGNKHAHIEGFAYSNAMKAVQGPWGYEELNHFLYKPRDYIPGTKMVFAGLDKVQDRADLIAYLRTLSDSPVPLPDPNAPAPAAAEPSAQ